jgi:hypothetical protein
VLYYRAIRRKDIDKKQDNLAVALSKLQQRICKTMVEALLNSEIKREKAKKGHEKDKYTGSS